MENYTRINELKYKLENKQYKAWAIKYGITHLCSVVRGLLLCGGGSFGTVEVTPQNVLALSQNDRDIIARVLAWSCGKRLLFHTAPAPYDNTITRCWCTEEDIEQ